MKNHANNKKTKKKDSSSIAIYHLNITLQCYKACNYRVTCLYKIYNPVSKLHIRILFDSKLRLAHILSDL